LAPAEPGVRHLCRSGHPLPYAVGSSATPEVFESFVATLTTQGQPLAVTHETLDALSGLCTEFRCPWLSAQLSDFRNSAEHQIFVLRARVEAIEVLLSATVAALPKAEVSPLSRFVDEVEGLAASSEPGFARFSRAIFALKSWILPDSAIVAEWPALFAEFRGKRFALLWRGSRDGFRASDFHGRCGGHANTLALIQDTEGNIFGGFTPVAWESSLQWKFKADPSLKSFLVTLKNPHNIPARKFALKAEKKDEAICGDFLRGPHFWDVGVYDNCNANTSSYAHHFGESYANDTGRDGKTFFTGSERFAVKEIEVFEVTD
jgi:hypothetical protein